MSDKSDLTPAARLGELCAGSALGDLTATERAELDTLREQGATTDDQGFALALAALELARAPRALEPMPTELTERLVRDGERHLSAADGGAGGSPEPARLALGVTAKTPLPMRSTSPRVAQLVWLAAAASLLIALWTRWPGAPGDALRHHRREAGRRGGLRP